jgi:tetratricopeptide (TPR) repeat protein
LKQVSLSLLLILFVVLCVSTVEAGAATVAGDSNKVSQLIAAGNNYAEKVFDNQKALEKYNEALSLSPNNYDILWRLSRTYVDIGEHLPNKTSAEEQKQLEFYEKSLDFAKKAIAVNPNGAMGFTRQAIANGRLALLKGVFKAPGLVKQAKADCEKAIMLDPTDATAYYVLGRTHAKVMEKPGYVRWAAGLNWGNMDDAIKNYEKSIELRPGFIMYRLDCARAYVEMEEYAKARQHLIKITSLQKEDEDDDTFRKEAAELLETIKDK